MAPADRPTTPLDRISLLGRKEPPKFPPNITDSALEDRIFADNSTYFGDGHGTVLKFRSTFIDVESHHSSSPRAKSEPDLHKADDCCSWIEEHDYVGTLSDKLSSIWSHGPMSRCGSMSMRSEEPHMDLLLDAQFEAGGLAPLYSPTNMPPGGWGAALAEPSYAWKKETGGPMSRKELQTRISKTTKNLSDNLKHQRTQQALCAIEELPEYLEEVLQQSVACVFEDVQHKVANMRAMIETNHNSGKKQDRLQEAVASLDVIPDIMWDSFASRAAEAKDNVRRRIDEVVKGCREGVLEPNQELLDEVRCLPSEVEHIAQEAMSAARDDVQAQANQQFDKAMSKLPEASRAISLARMEVMAAIPETPGTEDARSAAAVPIKQAVDAVKSVEAVQPALANQVVADILLRAKASEVDQRTVRDPMGPMGGLGGPTPVVTMDLPGQLAMKEPTDIPAPLSPRGSLMSHLPSGGALNVGSIGHPELCPRPCIYFANGHCQGGTACDFCHLPHPKRAAHLDKRHRDLLRTLTFEMRVAIVLPVLRQKVLQLDSSPETLRHLDAIATACQEAEDDEGSIGDVTMSSPTSGAAPELSRKTERMLSSALRCLSLRSLIVSLNRAPTTQRNCQQKVVDDLLHHLREVSKKHML